MMRSRGVRVAFGIAACVALLGCGSSYEHRVADTREAVEEASFEEALEAVEWAMGDTVDREDVAPLLLLERATLLQALGRHRASAHDFQRADGALEVLELGSTSTEALAEHLFSGAQGPYLSAPYERLLLNSLNMANHLALADLESARVEARRLGVMWRYVADSGQPGGVGAVGLGAYLAGLTHAELGERDAALRWYLRALPSVGAGVLAEPIACQLRRRGALRHPVLDAALERLVGEPRCGWGEDEGGVVVVMQSGYAPERVLAEMGAEAALAEASRDPDRPMPPSMVNAWRSWIQRSAVGPVRYPALHVGQRSYDRIELEAASGERWSMRRAVEVSPLARAWDEVLRPKVLRAALQRAQNRDGANALPRALGAGLLPSMVASATRVGLRELDTPDTRAWVSLPGALWVSPPMRFPAGEVWLDVVARGAREHHGVERIAVRGGALTVVVLRLP